MAEGVEVCCHKATSHHFLQHGVRLQGLHLSNTFGGPGLLHAQQATTMLSLGLWKLPILSMACIDFAFSLVRVGNI